MACKFGFYCHGSLLSSPRHKFCFGNGNIKDVKNADSTVHMYVVSICKVRFMFAFNSHDSVKSFLDIFFHCCCECDYWQ